jgi:hypothetical protein
MVLERIANPSIGESRFLSSSLSRTAKYFALLVKWYNTCFVIRGWQFDSVTGHHQKVQYEIVRSNC